MLVDAIKISPSFDYTVPSSFGKNTTYHCQEESGLTVYPEVCLAIIGHCGQLQDPSNTGALESKGIYVDLWQRNDSLITVTPFGRKQYPLLKVSCVLSTLDGVDKPGQYIFTYGTYVEQSYTS